MADAEATGRRPRRAARLAGAALLAATGGIHLDLYLTGYRTIPTIGPLFLAQVIAAFLLAAVVLVLPSRLVSLAGALFCASTLGGYALSIWVGLFHFREVRTTAGIVAGAVEVAAFALLSLAAVLPGGTSRGAAARLGERARQAVLLVAVASLGAAGVLAAAVASASPAAAPAPGGGSELRTMQVGGTTVLANSRGFTLYWFALDTSSASRCSGSCAAYWPPVPGPASAPGVPGRLGTLRRSGGGVQATYDGHPLYTYIGDSAPGQARGNNLDLNGGIWHEVAISR